MNRREEHRQEGEAADQPSAESESQQSAPATGANPSGGGEDTVAKLQELAQLHESGALTDEEFATAKAKLLG